MRFLFSGLMAVLVATAAACKGNPTADGSGEPVALRSDFAAVNVVIGTNATFTSWVTDVRLNRLEAPVAFTTCNASIATVKVDTSYHPVPATSMRAVIGTVLPGTTCVKVASSGLPGDSVGINVLKATPLLITTPTVTIAGVPAPSLVGATLNDTARVVGGFSTLSGTLTFKLYDSTRVTCPDTAAPRYSQTVTIPGTGAYGTSPGLVADKVGIWRWKVVYSGNINNKSVTSPCTATTGELVPIQAAITLTTAPNPTSGAVGVKLTDAATIAGGAGTPSGFIIFRLYGPSQPTCAGSALLTDSVEVDAGVGTYNTTGTGFTANVAGTWRWTAEYTGDAINEAKKSGCSDEQVTVT